jgi:4-amino-4-deoxy-L-arabinose transferase-like glycosyltransferase
MKAKLRKGLPWVLTALLLLVAIPFAVNALGDGFHERGHDQSAINSNYGHNQSQFVQGDNPMYRQDSMQEHHAMRERHEGGFHFIGSAVSFVFWAAVLVFLIRWLRKKIKDRRSNRSIIDMPISYQTYTANQNQPDFLDEWEKRQTTHKEEE